MQNELQDELEAKLSLDLPPPIPLTTKIQERLQYPIEALGEVLGNVTMCLAKMVQVPASMAGTSVLTATSIPCQALFNVTFDGRVYPLSINSCSIAESGDRKTSLDKLSHKPHHEFQRYLKNNPKSLELKTIQFLSKEPTVEGLIKALADGLPFHGLISNEGGQFFCGYGFNQENKVKTISTLSTLWDGEPQYRLRQQSGESSMLFDVRVSTNIMLQPRLAQELFSDPLYLEQGWLARTLVDYPKCIAGTRFYNRNILAHSPDLEAYYARIQACFEQIQLSKNLCLTNLVLSNEAENRIIEYHDSIEAQLSKGAYYHIIKPFAAKAVEHALRIAGNIHAMDRPNSTEISKEYMDNAILLTDYYLESLRRIYHTSHEEHIFSRAEGLLHWLYQLNTKVVSLQTIYQCSPRPLKVRDKSSANELVNILLEHHWLIPIPEGITMENKHHATAYIIRSL